MNHEGMNTPPPASKTATKLAPSTASPGDVALAVGVSPEAGASTSAAGNNDINASTALSSSSPQHWSGSPLKMVLFNKKKGEHDDSPPPRGGGHDDDGDDAPPLDVGGRLINAFEKGMQFALKANEMTNKGLEDARNSKAFARGREMVQRAEERQEQLQDMWEKLAMGISPFEKEDKEGAESPEERRRNKRDLYDKAGIRFYKPASDPARRERFYMRNFHLNYQPSTDGMSHVRGTGALDLPKEKQRRNFGPRALVKPRRHYVEYVDSCATVVSRHHFVQEIGEGVMPKTRTEKVLYALGKMWDSYMLSHHHRFLKAAKEGDMVTIEEMFSHAGPERDFVDLGDSFNRTPLYWASANGHVEVVKYLLDKGCNAAKADDNQRNAMYWARVNKHWDVYKVLKDRNNAEF